MPNETRSLVQIQFPPLVWTCHDYASFSPLFLFYSSFFFYLLQKLYGLNHYVTNSIYIPPVNKKKKKKKKGEK
jgi:hypothetical protein